MGQGEAKVSKLIPTPPCSRAKISPHSQPTIYVEGEKHARWKWVGTSQGGVGQNCHL